METESIKNIGLRGVTVADTHISMVDGKAGELAYRGFSIKDLAQQATYEEIIFLLLMGSPPTRKHLSEIEERLGRYRSLPDEVRSMLECRKKEADPMDVMQGAVATLADLDPDLQSDDRNVVYNSCLKLISRFATVAAAWHRIRNDREPVELDAGQSHAASFFQGIHDREPTKEEEDLIDLMLVLHADHTFNASTFTVREVASTQAHLYASVSAGVGALSGALHGGANANVMRMLLEIGDKNNVEPWIHDQIDSGKRIMGLGHAVYKTEDPRAGILREVARKALEGKDEEKWFDLGLHVEKIGREQLRIKKNMDLYPNVDFYSSPILYGQGLAIDMFPVVFAVSRVAGWCAHYLEERFAEAQPKPALYRPKANYTGVLCEGTVCEWPGMDERFENER